MMLARLAVLLALALAPAVAAAEGDSTNGQAVYAKYCAACHGTMGKGDGPGAAGLAQRPRDLTDKAYMAELKEQYLVDIVRKGGAVLGKSPLMPPWGSVLRDQEVSDVVAFVRALGK